MNLTALNSFKKRFCLKETSRMDGWVDSIHRSGSLCSRSLCSLSLAIFSQVFGCTSVHGASAGSIEYNVKINAFVPFFQPGCRIRVTVCFLVSSRIDSRLSLLMHDWCSNFIQKCSSHSCKTSYSSAQHYSITGCIMLLLTQNSH